LLVMSKRVKKDMRKSRARKGKSGGVIGIGGGSSMATKVTGGFPARVRVKLVYMQSNYYTTTTYLEQLFKGNSCFDPDQTGTGSQPYNFDDWAVQYIRYRVIGSHCTVAVGQSSIASAATNARFVLAPTNLSTGFVAYEDAVSSPLVTDKMWMAHGVNGYPAGPVAPGTLRANFTTREILGEDHGDRFQALVTADPADVWYWYIGASSADATSTITGWLHTRIVYDVEFFDRRPLSIDMKHTLHRMIFPPEREAETKGSRVDDKARPAEITTPRVRRAPEREAKTELPTPRNSPGQERKTKVLCVGPGRESGDGEWDNDSAEYPVAHVTSQGTAPAAKSGPDAKSILAPPGTRKPYGAQRDALVRSATLLGALQGPFAGPARGDID